MSNSNSAAKRRRANLVASPMFQSNGQPVPNNGASTTIQQPTTPVPRQPMSLQQVIGVFDRRLLYLEEYVSKQLKKVPGVEVIPTSNTSALAPSQNMNMNEVESLVQHILHEHLSEFNHRYELLAEEIIDLKHIVMKLQSYTLDVNKTLIDERIQILSELRSTAPVQVQNMAGSSQLSEPNMSENITASVEEEVSAEASAEHEHEHEQEQGQEASVEEPEHAASNKSKRNKARQKKVVQAIWVDDRPNEGGEIHAEVNA
jgi:hypothetical protein